MKVLKFGGTSVGSPQAIRSIISILKQVEYHQAVVVVSAFGGVTDQLLEISRQAANGNELYLEKLGKIESRHFEAITELISPLNQSEVAAQTKMRFNELEDLLKGVFLLRELSPKSIDTISGYGEILSAYIIHKAFQEAGLQNRLVDAREAIVTDRSFNNAKVNFDETNAKLKSSFAAGGLYVMAGFIARATTGEVTTLGRGGSDYTAAIVAAAIDASVLEIWTDVDGVLTANPKVVKKAIPISRLSYEEAMELSYFGAKVIYPPTIQPAFAKQIPLWIKNTFNPTYPGTLITNSTDGGSDIPIKGITSIPNICLLTLSGSGMVGIPGTSARLFAALANNGISVVLISQSSSEHTISLAISEKESEKAIASIRNAFQLEMAAGLIDPLRVDSSLSIVAIVGHNMKNAPGIAGSLFSALGKNGINIVAIAQGTSELNISFVIKREDEAKALNVVHEAFFLSDTKSVHLFLMGLGTVGSTLLKQLHQQQVFLGEHLSLDIKLAGISNSKKMVFDEEGIGSDWQERLQQGQEAALAAFVKEVIHKNYRNSVFIDCTASNEVSDTYLQLLSHNISVVTPNKVAASSSYAHYAQLNATARKRGVRFLYETNVGAGLPVLSTLNDLIKSGDRVLQIEAALSGTMNYIFNHVNKDTPFSKTVWDAKALGYTEPDPRIDLSGKDVARKILILAREAGYSLEMEDVSIESFLPQNIFEGDEAMFWSRLEQFDQIFEEQRIKVAAEGKQFRLMARFANGKATVALKSVSVEHPAYFLQGSDSIVLFTTERYAQQPLVVKGAGAGAEVTAAGVFADVIRIFS
ncbi:MAG: bifunctional aspartate kinase/homoserine dehydrogenase I [Chitinophagales bacterium]|nr:bifunctional aspartate kinase/homoserine dehydrogenase I [Chitinophagales bacterium]